MVKHGQKLASAGRAQIKTYHFPGLPSSGESVAPPDLQQAFQQGYDQGFEQGQQAGQQAGYETGYVSGLKQGREDGLEQGRQQGIGLGRASFDQAQQPLQHILQRLREWEQAQLPLQRELLLKLVTQVATQVVQHELTQTPETLTILIERILAGLPQYAGALTIWLSPPDVAALADVGIHCCEDWPIRAEPALQRGDCRIDTPDSTVESLCAERLQQSLAHLASILAGEA